MYKKILIWFCLCYTIPVFAIQPESSVTSTIPPLKVGVVLQMPFAQNLNGHYSGIAVDIWSNIAKTNDWHYTYIPIANNTESALKRLTVNGDLDIIIGPISVNHKRLQSVDFTRPFFLSSVIAITHKHNLNIFNVLRTFLSNSLLIYIMILIISFAIFITTLWYIEKGKLNNVFTHYYNALTKGILFHMFRNGMSVPKAFYARLVLTPTAIYSRILTIIWLLVAAIIFATINANYVASMTLNLNQSESQITTLKDLANVTVAGVEGETNVEIAEQNGIYIHKVKTLNEAMQLLNKSKVDAVVCDAPIGIEYLQQHKYSDLEISPLIIQNEELAFAVRLNSPIKHQVDIGITKQQDNDGTIKLCKKYIGAQATRCDM